MARTLGARDLTDFSWTRSYFQYFLLSTTTILVASLRENVPTVDPNGYVAFCPCMGRFGNQADQFLGALEFAHRINRTLILPHWIEYIPYKAGSNQIPFDTYFKIDVLQEYHRVIAMDDFMQNLAPTLWPPEKRISFCYTERKENEGCDAKDGNPFGPFWDNFKIDFISSEIFGPGLHYVNYHGDDSEKWRETYPGDKWPVLAFVGPPGAFPVEKKNAHLHQYLVWSDQITTKANEFISTLPKGPFIGIHLRNGNDWSNACALVGDSRDLFASPQCTGHRQEHGVLTHEMCFPTSQIIIKELKRAVKKINATSVFVASDSNHMISELRSALKNLQVSEVRKLSYESPHVDLAILGKSNIFIGNCVSSYSAFVKRERDTHGFPSQFWGFPPDIRAAKKSKLSSREEL